MTEEQELLKLYLSQRDKMSEFERDVILKTLYISLILKREEFRED